MSEGEKIIEKYRMVTPNPNGFATYWWDIQGMAKEIVELQTRLAATERTLSQYANSINWMTHTDQADDNLRRVWIGSGDGRTLAREALDDARATGDT